MIEVILSTIVKYWVEFLLGLVVAGSTFFIKRYIALDKKERKKERDEQYKEFTEGLMAKDRELIAQVIESSKQGDEALQAQINDLKGQTSALKAGVLSIQGKNFKDNCRRLLAEEHEITFDEWEEIDTDHEAYNGLGGNHKGDELFSLVKKKFEKTILN